MASKMNCKHCDKEIDRGHMWSPCYCKECLEDDIPRELARWAAGIVMDNAPDGEDPELIAGLSISKFTIQFWKTFSGIMGSEFYKCMVEIQSKEDETETT